MVTPKAGFKNGFTHGYVGTGQLMKHYLEFTKAWRWVNGVEEIFNSSNDIMYHEYQTCGLSYVGQLIYYHEPITLPIASPASSLQPYYWNEDEK